MMFCVRYFFSQPRWFQALIVLICLFVQCRWHFSDLLNNSRYQYRKTEALYQCQINTLNGLQKKLLEVKKVVALSAHDKNRCLKKYTVKQLLTDSQIDILKMTTDKNGEAQVVARVSYEEWLHFLRLCVQSESVILISFLVNKSEENPLLFAFRLRCL